MTAPTPQPDRTIDLKGVQCPMTFQMTLLTLEGMDSGQVLEVLMDDGAGVVNVPRDLKDQGHEILKVAPLDEKVFRIVIRKNG